MGSSRAALAIILGAVAAGTGGGLWWLVVNHKVPALTGPVDSPQPIAASREEPPAPPPGPPPSPVKPSMRPAPAPAAAPSFDVVRVEPHGDAVVAGKGEPNADVALVSGGRVLGTAKADGNGQFVILPPPLKPGAYDLTLRQTPAGQPASQSSQSVAVSVPTTENGSVVVALAEPGKATKLLSAPPGTAPAAPLPIGKVTIRSAELENGTGFFVSGAAAPHTPVHVYLNDSHLADVIAGADGAWSVRVKKGLTGGHYVVRADAGGAEGRAVASRAEVPFDVPVAMAAAAPPPPSSASNPPAADAAPTTPVAPPGADAIVEAVATARVTDGDNLWNISRFRLGEGKRYTQIYAANATQIRDPNLIYPGQVFVVPAR